jgi:hypothetical protein
MKNAIILLLVMVMASGCASSRLPSPLSAADHGQIKPLNLTVGIEPYPYPAYPDKLRSDLRKTKLFKAVDLRSNMKERPDLVAYVEEPICGTASMRPCLTWVTLGLIPTAVTEQHGEVFSFGFPDDPSGKVRVEFTYESTTLLGWLALFMNLSPNWSFNPPSTRRYLDGLARAISTNATAIKELQALK